VTGSLLYCVLTLPKQVRIGLVCDGLMRAIVGVKRYAIDLEKLPVITFLRNNFLPSLPGTSFSWELSVELLY
jgi:hypothetical protein